MRQVIVVAILLCSLIADSQPILRNYFDTNLNPVVYSSNTSGLELGLPDSSAFFAKVRSGTNAPQQLDVALVGSSTFEKYMVRQPLMSNLWQMFGNSGPGWIELPSIGPHYNDCFTPGVSGTNLGNWTYSGSSSGPSVQDVHVTSTNGYPSISITGWFANAEIHYLTIFNGGKFWWAVDGGTPTIIDTKNNASNGYGVAIAPAGSSGIHGLTISPTNVLNNGVYITGVNLKDTNSGVRVHNLGFGGSTSFDWLLPETNKFYGAHKALGINTYFVLLGANDNFVTTDPNNFKSNISALCLRFRAANTNSDIVLLTTPYTNNGTNDQENYNVMIRQLSHEFNYSLLDLASKWGTFAQNTNRGVLSTDLIHPSFAGGQNIADIMTSHLTQKNMAWLSRNSTFQTPVTAPGFWISSNLPPPFAAHIGDQFLWNSNATHNYILISSPTGTNWTLTNKIGGP